MKLPPVNRKLILNDKVKIAKNNEDSEEEIL